MKRLLLNADIGERGPDHPADLALMDFIDIASIACGGHAGDRESVTAFSALAREKKVRCAAHLSYPDREDFGRKTIMLTKEQLLHSLDEQLKLMPDTEIVKLHGALYNNSVFDNELALSLCEWLTGKKTIGFIITPEGSEMAHQCRIAGMQVLAEAFADRRYMFHPATCRLSLVDRQKPYACITDPDDAVRMMRMIIDEGKVPAIVNDASESPEFRIIDIVADTICIHSDSPIALEIARPARKLLDEKYRGQYGDG